jgi:ABC-type nickel/cobalt efflux system permease component RcnA
MNQKMNNAYKPPESAFSSSELVASRNTKMYRISGAGIATFAGSMFAGGWVLAKNFRVLGDHDRARKMLIYSGVGTVVMLSIGFAIPESWNIPNVVFLVPQLLAMHQYAKRNQEAHIQAHVENGGQLESNWKAFGVGMLVSLGLICCVAVVFALFLAT